MNRIILLISLLSAVLNKATAQSELQTLYNSLKGSVTAKQTITNLKFDLPYYKGEIAGYSTSKLNGNDFNIKSSASTDVLFYLVNTNGFVHGVLLDKKEEQGYKIIADSLGNLRFVATPKSELIFQCESGSQDHVHGKSIPFKKYLGNSSSVSDVLKLESNPGASKIIYLDFDGETSLDNWNYTGNPVQMSDSLIRKIWEAVSEDFIAFDVNVTTNRSLFDSEADLNKTWVVFEDFGSPGWLGVAHLGSYGTGEAVLVDLTPSPSENDLYLFRTPSHELGHAFSLNHDGFSGGAYYTGHGEFAPIMGTGDRPVSHWSTGNYPTATNFENDIQIILGNLGANSDDKTNAQNLIIHSDSVSLEDNNGIIESSTDVDSFVVNLSVNGDIDLRIGSPVGFRTNLDVKATLITQNGATVLTSQPIGDRSAYIKTSLNAGTYYLLIEGGGELSSSDGFSDYSSMGYYEISGFLGYISARSNFDFTPTKVCKGETITFDNLSLGTDVSYLWSFNGANISTSSAAAPSIQFTQEGVQTVTLDVTNSAGTSTYSKDIFVGDPVYQLSIPKSKVNPNLTGEIAYNNQLIHSFNYSDFDTSGTNATLNLCLTSNCFSLKLNDVFFSETCGEDEWKINKVYNGGDKVYHNGYIYTAGWWTKGDDPASNHGGGKPWTRGAQCLITDASTEVKIENIISQKTLFTATPVDAGLDLDIEDQFCDLITNIMQLEQDQTFVYPNPTLNKMKVHTSIANATATVYNVSGSMVWQDMLSDQKVINVEELPSGIYYLHLTNSSITQPLMVKFIKL